MTNLDASQVKTQSLEHLGLIVATIKNIGLLEKIDKRLSISKNKGAKVSMGKLVAAMILNGVGITDDRLYMFPEFLSNKPIDRLLGEGLKAEYFNDNALGRCLDEIYAYGVTKLFSEIAFEIGIENNLLGKSVHFDSSTLSVYGEYENKELKTNEEENSATKNLTQGYSKEHRYDLNQMVINLATTGTSGFPIWMETHNGASDKVIIQEATTRMKNACQHSSFLYIGDSAMYENCVKTSGDLKWLSRVPETVTEAKNILGQAASNFSWTDVGNGYQITPLVSSYGNVQQRWLLVYSEQAYEKEVKTLEKKIKQENEVVTKELWHLSNQAFACEKEALKASKEHLKKLKYHKIDWELTTQIRHREPKKDVTGEKVEYFITGKLTEDPEKIEHKRRLKGRFILATNELDENKLSYQEMLPEYKEQSKTESGFPFIKGNIIEASSVFLKKPSRVAALMMVMTLCLMVYSFAQYHLQEALKITNETIPNQLRKATQKPTMSWVFRMFNSVSVVSIELDIGVQTVVANLNEVTKRIVRYFGAYAEAIYAINGKKSENT